MKIKSIKKTLLLLLYAFMLGALTACGGGGDKNSNTNLSVNNSNWDSLVWDQNQWH